MKEMEDLNTLIVSCDKKNTVHVIKALQNLGFKNVSYKEDGIEAIDLIKNGDIDFIICDMDVNLISGWLLIKEIKVSETIRNLPAMLFGVEDPPAEEEELKQYGIVKYLKLPINVSQISFAINSTLQLFSTSGTIENKYTRAKSALLDEKVDDAIELYSDLRGQTENNVRSSLGLAQAHIANQDYDQANDLIEEVASKDTTTPSTMLIGIRSKLSRQDFNGAKEIIQKLMDSFSSEFYYKEIIQLSMKYKAYKLAEEYSLEAIDLKMTNEFFYIVLAKSNYFSENYDKALDFIEHIEESSPNISEVLNLKGVCYKKMGFFSEAMGCYEQALRLSPSDPKIYFNLAMVAINLKNYDDAINYLDNCLKINPNFSKAREKRDELIKRAG